MNPFHPDIVTQSPARYKHQGNPLRINHFVAWQPALMSLLWHLMLLGLVVWVLSRMNQRPEAEVDRRGEVVLTHFADDSKIEYSVQPVPTPDPFEFSGEPSSRPIEPPDVPMVEASTASNRLSVLEGLAGIEARSLAATETQSAGTPLRTLSASDLQAIADEQRELQSQLPKGPVATLRVFGGGELTGRSFVFLIDRSQSMGETGLGVLKLAREELYQAINQLQPSHRFQILVYHNQTSTMARREWLVASDENKKLVGEFFDGLAAFGGTDHFHAIVAALAYRADVIVMLSDGGLPELHDGHLAEIGRYVGKTQIHAVQFGAGALRDSNEFMRRLAERYAGSYKYVDVRQRNKNHGN